ncbi:cell adhesion molecule CEACAM19 isoform 3-T3 [Dama dama]|uniref:carcinoembryonic antigen-related cell adhesion molecule 19 isoform X3 n=1 Tax=Dama dama TaxID=30532 RepID=UPI002A359749|nr:carcinoembryonic antigen-related cell adhesion molecule 19 isoform X3 [Dama dama]
MEIPAGTQHAFPKSLLLSGHPKHLPGLQLVPGGGGPWRHDAIHLHPQAATTPEGWQCHESARHRWLLQRLHAAASRPAQRQRHLSEKPKELPVTNLPVSAGIVAAIVIGSLATGCILVGSIAYLLVTRGWRAQNHRITTTEKPELGPSHHAVAAAGTDLSSASGDDIYEAMPSPVLLVSPLGDMGPMNTATPPDLPLPPPPPPPLPEPEPEPEHHPYQDLLNPDPAPYCQLVPAP